MRNNTRSKVRKILLLASVLVLMLALCGCRTRITNNDEVSNVMYDEEGFMQDEYNMRRDELGLSRAKKPIFTGFGAPEDDYEDYDYGEDAQTLEDYEPDESEEPYNDTEETETAQGSSSGSGTSGSGTGRVIRRRSTSGGSSSSDTTTVEVVLDANGGSFDGDKTVTVKVEKTGKYESLPVPTAPEGQTFAGWFTKSSGGTNVIGKKVASSKKHKLYAHWETSSDPAKKTYTVTLDANGGSLEGGNTLSVEEGSAYGTLPEPTYTGYTFDGWYTAADGGDKIESGTAFTANSDQTLYAHWTKDPYKYWTTQLKGKADAIEEKYKYKSGTDAGEFLQDCGMESTEGNDYDFEIFYGSKEDATPGDRNILVIPKEATKGTTEDNVKLLYKLKVITKLYEDTGLDISKAAEELEVNEADLKSIEIITAGSDDPA